MKVYVVIHSKKVEKLFQNIKSSRTCSVTMFDAEDEAVILKKVEPDTVLYYDVSGFDDKEKKKILKVLEKRSGVYGIIELDIQSDDPSQYFLSGASDYIGPRCPIESIDVTRFKTVLNYHESMISALSSKFMPLDVKPFSLIEDFPGWKNLEIDKEYSFFFLYVQLGQITALQKKIGEHRMNELKDSMNNFLGKITQSINGRPWLFQEYQTIVIFPYKNTNAEIIPLIFKTLLNSVLVSYEEFKLEIPCCLRFALHAGRTAWREMGDTGTIVSDAINYVFHLGSKYAEDENLYISEDAFSQIMPNMIPYTVDIDPFEGKQVKRLKKFFLT